MQDELKNISAEAIWKFAVSNGMLEYSFKDVVDEFLTTKEVADAYQEIEK